MASKGPCNLAPSCPAWRYSVLLLTASFFWNCLWNSPSISVLQAFMPAPCLKYSSPGSCMSDPCSPFGSSCPVALSGCPKVFPSLASRMHPPCSSLAQWCLVQCLAQCACQVTACWEMNEWTSTWNEGNRHTRFKITCFFHWIFFFWAVVKYGLSRVF